MKERWLKRLTDENQQARFDSDAELFMYSAGLVWSGPYRLSAQWRHFTTTTTTTTTTTAAAAAAAVAAAAAAAATATTTTTTTGNKVGSCFLVQIRVFVI